jgi:hypothetical protein
LEILRMSARPGIPTIVIEVLGGVVTAVYSDRLTPEDVEIELVDWDVYNDGSAADREEFRAGHGAHVVFGETRHDHAVDRTKFPHLLF